MAEHTRFLQKLFWLLQDCGMPDKIPDSSLLYEIYLMIEEHCEMLGVDLE